MNDDEIKRKLHEYTSGSSAKQNDAEDNGIVKFDKDYTGVKNVCFVMLDGKHIFLNYSYLVAGEFFPEESKITLHFTTHVIILHGRNLENLYHDLMQHLPKVIIATDERYSGISQGNNPMVIKILVNV
ncbi:MAG: hypothetical protein JNM71_05150 [Flavobacterium lindanitolerans]|uniref:hypothetical protein n=1 Tax=Flavobacterium lindanitolerans TaxID=428988 RepID=UPI001A47AA45|nr:hypothetical protein [Flavobacterium lindanitolerans]MBL7867385.1 hypothetical protein [Flavobacterium lindanitolerans]